MLDEEGEVVQVVVGWTRGDDPEPIVRAQRNPWQLVWRETADTEQPFAARFGLTPSDRSQLSVKEPDRGNGVERLLS